MGWFSDIVDSIGDLGQSIIDVTVDAVEDVIDVVGDIGQSIIDVAVDGLSGIISWIVPEPDIPDMQANLDALESKYKGVLVNKTSNIANLPVVYGQRKIGGTLVFVATSGTDNTYLYVVMALCEGEIHSIGDVYINDKLSTDSSFSGLLSIAKHTGSDAQAADSTFTSADIGWTSSHKLSGVAYLAIRFKWDQDVFGSIPTIHAVVQGKKVYDIRTSTTATSALSSNNALCMRDYLTNTRYGKGLPSAFIDDASFTSAANKCDALVTSFSGSAQQKIFECNAVVNTSASILSNTRSILSGMRGLMPYHKGLYGLVVEDQGSSVFSFDESHIIGGISIRSESKKTKFNRVIVTFPNPAANWQMDQIEYPVAGSSEEAGYLVEDGGVELVKQLDLPSTTNIYTAQDIAKMALKRSRNALLLTFQATSEALNVSVGDIVDVTHSTPVWDQKEFRVLKMSLNSDGTVGLNLVEHQDSIYPWSEKTEADDSPDTNLPNPYNVSSPLPVVVTEELYTTVNSKGTQSRASFVWSAPNDAFVAEYEAWYKLSSASVYTFITNTSALEARIDDIAAGQYDFKVRSISTLGAKSEWAYLYNKTIAGLTAVPSDVLNFSIRALDGQCHLSWSRITDLDVINGGYVRIRHSPLVASATWEDGQDIGEAIAGSQTATVLPLLAGTYMAKAVDEGGRFSTNAKFAVTTVPNIVDFNAVITATENPSFAGTKSDMIVNSNVLQLDGAPRYLLAESSDFLTAENGDGLSREIGDVGVIEESGTYNFANSVDLGATYTSRLTAQLSSSVAVASDLIDNRVSNIDTWQNWDGASSDAITAILQLRTTEDDPTSSPTWSDWAPFLVGDYHARAYEFRVVVTNTDANYNISITALAVAVDMPDRSEKANDLSLLSGGTSIAFGSNFKATPVIGVTIQDGDSGDYFRVTSKARTGFTVQCFNSSNTGIVRSINWQAIGYGKEAA
jgi:hypothetical protein